jgi:hypothetical protein
MVLEDIQVVDSQGQQRDWDWLRASFGDVKITRAQPSAGETMAYRVVKVQDLAGPAVQVVKVADQDGKGLQGKVVARYWPGAPVLPKMSSAVSKWHPKGVSGKTNEEGMIGFGMGHGDYYFAPNGGASSVWVADEAGPSDLISGLGMLGGTNHRHLEVYYQLQAVEPVPHEDPEEDPSTSPVEPPANAPPEEGPTDPPGEPTDDPPEDPRSGPPETPPEEPAQPSTELWRAVIDKLDLIIALLEEKTG